MRIVTHEFTDTLSQFSKLPSFRFENKYFHRKMETSGRQTLTGPVINRIYVESLEFPQTIDKEHQCLFIVSVPYYTVFRRMYQERFGAVPTSFDELSTDHIVAWVMDTYNVKVRKAKKLLEYFRWSLLKMLHNPDAVSMFLTGNAKEPFYCSYTYETIYKYLMKDVSVSATDYLRALAKYNQSRTAVTKWLIKKLEKEDSNVEATKLLLWLQDKSDVDLLLFAREVL